MVDIDGVISLFGAPQRERAGGSFHSIDGIPHYLSSTAAAHLHSLSGFFELVWASGWEERANDYLPHLLGLPAGLPFLSFSRDPGFVAAADTEAAGPQGTRAHWKLASVEAYAGTRSLAWIDDAFNDACHAWAAERAAPTLLVATDPKHGLTAAEARQLLRWAELQAQVSRPAR